MNDVSKQNTEGETHVEAATTCCKRREIPQYYYFIACTVSEWLAAIIIKLLHKDVDTTKHMQPYLLLIPNINLNTNDFIDIGSAIVDRTAPKI